MNMLSVRAGGGGGKRPINMFSVRAEPHNYETQGQKLAAYVSVLIPVLLFAGTYGHFSSCLLL